MSSTAGPFVALPVVVAYRLAVGQAVDLVTASVICVALYAGLFAICAAAGWRRRRRKDDRHATSVRR
jgi:hypothetical protein